MGYSTVAWDLTPYAGKKMFLKIVDRSTGGWGHITADSFQFDAEVIAQHPERAKLSSSTRR